MFRFNNPDALLVLVLVGAAYATQRAIERGGTRWLVAALALVSWAFLLSGFSYWIAYPAALLLLGFLTYRRRRA
jgi:O-antigen ligase